MIITMNQDQSPQPKKSFWSKLFGGGSQQPSQPTQPPVEDQATTPSIAPLEPVATPPTEDSMASSTDTQPLSSPTVSPDPAASLPQTEASSTMEQDFTIPAPEEVVTPTESAANDTTSFQDTSSPDINVNVNVGQPNEIPQPPVDPMVTPVQAQSESTPPVAGPSFPGEDETPTPPSQQSQSN
jgi:hypothetical protein